MELLVSGKVPQTSERPKRNVPLVAYGAAESEGEMVSGSEDEDSGMEEESEEEDEDETKGKAKAKGKAGSKVCCRSAAAYVDTLFTYPLRLHQTSPQMPSLKTAKAHKSNGKTVTKAKAAQGQGKCKCKIKCGKSSYVPKSDRLALEAAHAKLQKLPGKNGGVDWSRLKEVVPRDSVFLNICVKGLAMAMSNIKAATKGYGCFSAGHLKKPRVDIDKCGLVVEDKNGFD